MKTFKEFQEQVIKEMAIAGKGRWLADVALEYQLFDAFISNYKLIKSGIQVQKRTEKFDLYKLISSANTIYKLGYRQTVKNEDNFIIVASIELEEELDILDYKNVWNVNWIKVANAFQNTGIAKQLYRYFVEDLHMTLQGDMTQYFGARLVWSKLSKIATINVDIVDIHDKQILEKDVIVHQGKDDGDFDQRVWFYGKDKMHIRLFMTHIT